MEEEINVLQHNLAKFEQKIIEVERMESMERSQVVHWIELNGRRLLTAQNAQISNYCTACAVMLHVLPLVECDKNPISNILNTSL
jgi:hypothetical protein